MATLPRATLVVCSSPRLAARLGARTVPWLDPRAPLDGRNQILMRTPLGFMFWPLVPEKAKTEGADR